MKKKKGPSADEKRDMIEGLVEQRLCCRERKIAKWLADKGARLESLAAGQTLITEGADDKDVFCIVSGSVDIFVTGHRIGERGRGDHVGEMAMIMKEQRTASVVATKPSAVVRIPVSLMRKAYKKYPCMWEPIAKVLCSRLHERRKFFRAKNKRPQIFIGSSGARRLVAQQLRTELEPHVAADIHVWVDDDIFKPSSSTLESLIEQSKICDFGIFVFGADDDLSSKGEAFKAPRDNVVFEGGMFTGSCGISRTFFLCERHPKLKMPSDLNGVTNLKFGYTKKTARATLARPVKQLAAAVNRLGVV